MLPGKGTSSDKHLYITYAKKSNVHCDIFKSNSYMKFQNSTKFSFIHNLCKSFLHMQFLQKYSHTLFSTYDNAHFKTYRIFGVSKRVNMLLGCKIKENVTFFSFEILYDHRKYLALGTTTSRANCNQNGTV